MSPFTYIENRNSDKEQKSPVQEHICLQFDESWKTSWKSFARPFTCTFSGKKFGKGAETSSAREINCLQSNEKFGKVQISPVQEHLPGYNVTKIQKICRKVHYMIYICTNGTINSQNMQKSPLQDNLPVQYVSRTSQNTQKAHRKTIFLLRL